MPFKALCFFFVPILIAFVPAITSLLIKNRKKVKTINVRHIINYFVANDCGSL